MAHGICEGLWLKKVQEELKRSVVGPMKFVFDNKEAVGVVHNLIQNYKTKHVEIDIHFIKEKLGR